MKSGLPLRGKPVSCVGSVPVGMLLVGAVLRAADRGGTQVVLHRCMNLVGRLADVDMSLRILTAAVRTADGVIAHFLTSFRGVWGSTWLSGPGWAAVGTDPDRDRRDDPAAAAREGRDWGGLDLASDSLFLGRCLSTYVDDSILYYELNKVDSIL